MVLVPIDEPVDQLGTSLKLRLAEPQRAVIERSLAPFAVQPVNQEARHD
jgi:hypothetical protein